MNILVLFVCFSLYVGCSEAHVYEPCNPGWTRLGVSCYRLFGENLNQAMAQRQCAVYTSCNGGVGHLVSVNSQDENEFLYYYIIYISGVNPPPAMWLGGKRNGQTGTWSWGDGSLITGYTNWVDGSEPQDQGRNCMAFDENQKLRWRNINCEINVLPYICKMAANLPVDPQTCVPTTPSSGAPALTAPVPFRYTKEGNIEQRYMGPQ